MDELAPAGTAQTPTQGKSRTRVIWAIVILVVLLVIAAVLFFVLIQGDRLGSRIGASLHLHGVTIVSATEAQPQLYSFGVFGLKKVTLSAASGDIIEYAEEGGTKAFIQRNAGASTTALLIKGSNKELGASEPYKAALAIAPSGKFIAYSSATSTEKQLISAWTTHLYDVTNDRDTVLGTGYGAQFATHEGKDFLIYTTPAGIQYLALETMDGFLTPFDIFDNTYFAVKVSPDGKYLASRDSALREWGLFSITKLEVGFPIRLNPIESDLSAFTSVAFTGNTLIGIDHVWADETRSASVRERVQVLPLRKAETASSTVLYTFPSESRFVFNHL